MKTNRRARWISIATVGAVALIIGQVAASGALAQPARTQYSGVIAVQVAGDGSGRALFNPPGSACQAPCLLSYADATTVTVTALPDAGSVFGGWSGDCTRDPCSLRVGVVPGQSFVVTATFRRSTSASPTPTPSPSPAPSGSSTLTASVAGPGKGSIRSAIGGIACPGDCTMTLGRGETVVLTATPAAASSFAGWSGACSGRSTCSVTGSGAAKVAVAATFVQVAAGGVRCVVPRLAGRTVRAARLALKLSNCTLGAIAYRKTSAAKIGKVLGSTPVAGTKMARRAPVAVVVGTKR